MCSVKRHIDFLILLIHTPLVSALFCSILTFCSFLKCFSFLLLVLFEIYVIIVSHSINAHTGDYGRPTEAI